jgi:hypothetical protein
MQSQKANHRKRGYRESRTFVSRGKLAASDLARLRQAQQVNEQTALELRDLFVAPRETSVSAVQHLRAQLAFYLRNN